MDNHTSKVTLCGRCCEEVDEIFDATCNEKPERWRVTGIKGMYHCPDCGTMLVEGMFHPKLCKRCIDKNHPSFDK